MASLMTDDEQSAEDVQDNRTDQDQSSMFGHAWKSVRKHFPNSFIKSSNMDKCSIFISPMHDIDLTIEVCFNHRNKNGTPSTKVSSGTLSEVFIGELSKILTIKCSALTNWQSLGDEIEKILQCVEIKRKEKGVKIKKKKIGKKKSTSEASVKSRLNDEINSHVHDVQELYFDLNLNSYGKQEIEEKLPRPNYFIAVRIHDRNIIKSISTLQNCLVNQEILLAKGVIPNTALHLTLCNLGLDTADNLLSAIEAINQMKPELETILPKAPLIVHGVSQFYNRAIYAKVQVSEEFITFRNMLRKNLESAGIEFREDHEGFTPHVTIIKVRRPERRAFGKRNIESSLYESYINSVYGEQAVNAIYLCAMGGQLREDGFYATACELHFTSENNKT